MTLYKKVGNNFLPVIDTEALSGLDNGHWLVTIESGSRTCTRCLNPANGELELAAILKAKKIVQYLSEASAGRPKNQPLTKKEQKALKAFYEIAGKDSLLYWEYPSLNEIAHNILQLIIKNDRV